jgi:nucleoside-diphosphate-sugar epimerase
LPDRSARFKCPVLLIVGCGDIGLRVARQVVDRWRVLALTSSSDRLDALRATGAVPLRGDLDRPETLARLAGLADAVLHLAPPAAAGMRDTRTAYLVRALARSPRLRCLVYGSTSGVYGDAAGAWIDETAPLRPATDRARRRAEAEQRLRFFGRSSGVRVTLLRIPGIYALDRAGGDPRQRLLRGTPLLVAPDDVFTNHIHADDLARACVLALHRGLPQRAVNVNDDSELRMGEYFDLVADLFKLPRAPRLSRGEAAQRLSALQLSFLEESRRLVNRRLKQELRLVLRYPSVESGLRASPD